MQAGYVDLWPVKVWLLLGIFRSTSKRSLCMQVLVTRHRSEAGGSGNTELVRLSMHDCGTTNGPTSWKCGSAQAGQIDLL
jgi:hypothetical protein